MIQIGPRSIRGKVTLIAGVATAVAMILIVIAMGLGMRAILENAISSSLHDRLDQARVAVEEGDYRRAADASGNEVIQVIDENGNVVAESRNARGLTALVGKGDETELKVGDLSFSRVVHAGEDPEHEESSSSSRNGAASDDADNGDYDSGDTATIDGSRYSVPDDDDGDADDADDSDDADDKSDDADVDDRDKDGADDEGEDADERDDDNDERDADDDSDDDADGENEMDDDKNEGAIITTTATTASSTSPSFLHNKAWADEPARFSQSAKSAVELVDASAVLGSEGPYLILNEQAESPDGPMTLVAVASLAFAAESARQTAWLLAVIMAAVLVAVIAFAWMLTGRTLRPVEDMRAKAASITAENLNERIDVPRSDKDLARLAETLNEMIARIGQSLEEEKRFISDASHELKSPLTATSLMLDALRAHPDTLSVSQTVDDLAGENARMSSIVGDLLTLTRFDEGRLTCNPEPIDLLDLLIEETMALSARSSVQIDATGVQPIVCSADTNLLGHAVRNLLDNAARYANEIVKVSCGFDEEGSVNIRISDDGPGIDPSDRKRVFGRFVCLDERSGTGLGLAVAESAIAAHGGTLSFIDPELEGATALIRLPQ